MYRLGSWLASTLFMILPFGAAKAESAADNTNDPNVIVVVGTRSARAIKDSPVVVRVIDQREITAAGDVTAADAMSRVVGVTIDTSLRAGQTPQIQGFGSKHVLVLINGRPANGRLTDDFDLTRIPASSIERIEVLKGASSVLYGSDAIGGVINIVTRRPRAGLHAGARLQRDSLRRNEGQLSLTGGDEQTMARLDFSHQIGPSFDLSPGDSATTGNAYERNNLQLELATKPLDSLELSAIVGGDSGASNGVSLGAASALIDTKTKGAGSSRRLASTFRPQGETQVRLDLGESERRYKLTDAPRSNAAGSRQLDSRELVRDATLVASASYLETQESTLGVEGAAQELRYSQIGDAPKERQRSSVFFQHAWRPIAALTLVPGVRLDHDSQFGEHVSKALTARLDPTAATALRVSYGEGYRAPSFAELYLDFANAARGYRVLGNAELAPERSRSYQASLSWQPTRELWTSLSAFDNRAEDLVVNVRSGVAPDLVVRYANADSVRNRGLEASGRGRLAERWILGLDYMFLHARDEQRARALDGRAMHSGAVQARYAAKDAGFSAALTMNLVGKRPYYAENAGGGTTSWSKAYRSATLRLAQEFATHGELFAGVRNLTDEGQELYNPVPPRSYFAGVGAQL